MKFLVTWQGKRTAAGATYARVIDAETKEAAGEAATVSEKEKHGSWFRIIDITNRPVITRGNRTFVKTYKGHGREIHIADVYDNGTISGNPVCGSGVCRTGTRYQFMSRVTSGEVSCRKCLAKLESLK